ncbi:thermonuclease family protein [Virgibacillus doumboii]|uniref:thermonuclease family protein n=1 Tax=Virgibacillus doumboii TaxID=2697503 RepID=UPI001FE79D33|nr:thermonuclease family protein [Virgibacillus doumboii]
MLDDLFLAFMLISLFCLFLGLFYPKYVLFWLPFKASRGLVASIFPALTVIFFILFGITAPPVEELADGNKTKNVQTEETVNKDAANKKEDSERDKKDTKEKTDTDNNKDNKQNNNKSKTDKNTAKNNNTTKDTSKPEEDTDKKKENVSTESPAPSAAKKATVKRVVDGDTVEIKYNGSVEDVRLLLVDTPETVHPSKPVQPVGPKASTFAKNTLTQGETIKIEFDGPKRDHYDRLLGYIWDDGKNFNKMLLKKGLARYAYVYDPPYTHQQTFQQAESYAKSRDLGIWSMEGYVTPDGFTSKSNKSEDTSSSDSSGSNDNSSSSGYDPNGPDRDCGDFDTQHAAQDFYEAAGGPDEDPHRLDGSDNDGKVCESLP